MIFAGTLIVTVLVVSCHAAEHQDQMSRVRTCAERLGIPMDELMKAFKDKNWWDPTLHCWNYCMMTELGMIEGRELKYENLKRRYSNNFRSDLNVGTFDEAHEQCVEEVQQEEDDCVMAHEYGHCMKQKYTNK